MAWQDRLKEAAYTTPSGRRLTFMYENVGREFGKKTSAFNFPDAEGTFVQDHGRTGRRLPLRLFFTGNDYDIEATAFEEGLAEAGRGKLEHPVYRTLNVVPFGVIKRRDDLKTAANQAILEVVFWETIDILFPTGQVSPSSAVLTAVEEYDTAASEQFEETLDLDTAIEETTFKNRYERTLSVAESFLKGIARAESNVEKEFNAIVNSINNGIDILVDDPLTLGFQTIRFLQTPAKVTQDITARLDAYKNLAESLIAGDGAVQSNGNDSQSSNAFQNDDIFVSTAVTGMILSVVNNQFETKPEAISAAEAILDLASDITIWRDANYESLGEIDTGIAYQQFQEAVALTAGFLVEISFDLKQEKILVLDRARTIVDLAAQLYGEVDPQLDFLIKSNSLTGSEILELPKGREIKYYI